MILLSPWSLLLDLKFQILTIYNTVVILRNIIFNIKMFYILAAESICTFRMVLTINSHDFPKHY
jgi:hypothetical protein